MIFLLAGAAGVKSTVTSITGTAGLTTDLWTGDGRKRFCAVPPEGCSEVTGFEVTWSDEGWPDDIWSDKGGAERVEAVVGFASTCAVSVSVDEGTGGRAAAGTVADGCVSRLLMALPTVQPTTSNIANIPTNPAAKPAMPWWRRAGRIGVAAGGDETLARPDA